MTKKHYISFLAYLSEGGAAIYKLYPEWDLQLIIPRQRAGILVWYCTEHGLFTQPLKPTE